MAILSVCQPYFCKDIPSAIIYFTSYRRYSHSAPLERERQTLLGYRHGQSLSHSLFTRLIPAGALVHGVLAFLYTFGISIALAIRSLDPTLGLLEAGAQCAPYKCTFQTGS